MLGLLSSEKLAGLFVPVLIDDRLLTLLLPLLLRVAGVLIPELNALSSKPSNWIFPSVTGFRGDEWDGMDDMDRPAKACCI